MSTVVPPPPSGSILQKQSSFSRPKIANAAATTTNSNRAEPSSSESATGSNGLASMQMASQRLAVTPQYPRPAPGPPAAPTTQSAGAPPSASPARLGGGGGGRSAVSPAVPVSGPPAAFPPSQSAGAPPSASPARLGGGGGRSAVSPAVPVSGPPAAFPPSQSAGAPPSASPARLGGGGGGRSAVSPAVPVSGPPAAFPPSQSAGAPPSASPARLGGGGGGRSAVSPAVPVSGPPAAFPPSQSAGAPPSASPAPLGMWGPNGQLAPGPPTVPSAVNSNAYPEPNMVRKNSMKGRPQSSLGLDQMGGYGSMGGGQMNGSAYGSMGGGQMNGSAYGSMGGGQMNGSAYGSMGGGQMNGSAYGSMGGGMGSMYRGGGPSSMMGGSMMMPMSSLYGMGGTSTMGIAAQWGSLANMSMGGRNNQENRSIISSGYGGFASEAKKIDTDDLCPNIGTFEDAKDLPRSGKRGGNHLYSRGKHEKPTATGNSNVQAMVIRRKPDLKSGSSATKRNDGKVSNSEGASSGGASHASPSTTANTKVRAKAPSNYNIHSLILLQKVANDLLITVKDPTTVVFEKGGKKETFEEDEALTLTAAGDDIDSVLLSELRGNWFNGHNSALILSAGENRIQATNDVARQFLRTCVERLEKNEADTSVKFDITMTMVSLRGADQCCDLLKSGASYEKVMMGSSPVYGPCLLGLESKVHRTANECMDSFDAALKNAKDEKEIIAGFFILKTIKKAGTHLEVHLSSLCIALCGERIAHKSEIREKASSAPHRLFRYAVDGPCVTVSALCIASNDETAREGLEVERKMREVKNQPPRSGNVKRFVDYTSKEIARQKEKVASASGSEKRMRSAQIERMEEMVKDAKEILDSPEKTLPKGYSTGR